MILVLLLFMHLLVVDKIIVILFCTMFQGIKRILTKSLRREQLPQIESLYKIVMLTYKSYYNSTLPYVCELINKKARHVNTRLRTDHHWLIMPVIGQHCSNTLLECSFIYAAPCKWNKLSEHIKTTNFDCFKKSVKTMLFTQQY